VSISSPEGHVQPLTQTRGQATKGLSHVPWHPGQSSTTCPFTGHDAKNEIK